MADLSVLGLTAALLAGAISFVSPCVLPLVPGYVSHIAGRTATGVAAPSRGHVVWLSLCFVLGFSTIFMALGQRIYHGWRLKHPYVQPPLSIIRSCPASCPQA